ncbi:hypothetical protein [Faecalibaculum rodentium]|uniref:hypothetical protein n=1 Tax=Faecalibaculum rodentium TaxID=1702221 RepID=UPI0023F34774|nr:hypothetical protein [Faecalibaculum rodentium]
MITLQFKDKTTGKVVGTKTFTVTADKPMLTSEQITKAMPTGCKRAGAAMDMGLNGEDVRDGKGMLTVLAVKKTAGLDKTNVTTAAATKASLAAFFRRKSKKQAGCTPDCCRTADHTDNSRMQRGSPCLCPAFACCFRHISSMWHISGIKIWYNCHAAVTN